MSLYKFNIKSLCTKLITMSLVACLAITPVFSSAANYDDAIKDAQAEKDKLNNEVNAIEQMLSEKQDELSSVSSEIAKLEAERLSMMSTSEMAVAELNFLKDSIANSEAELAALEEEFAELERCFVERARLMYQQSQVDMFSLFFESENIFDFIDKVNLHKKIVEEDTAMLEQIKADKAQLELKRERQETLFKDKEILLAEIESAIADIENQTTIIEGQYQNLSNLLSSLAEEEEFLNDKISSIDDNISSLEKKKKEQEEEEERKRQEQLAQNKPTGNGSNISRDESAAGFCWPVESYYYISSPFGYRTHPITHKWSMHTGVDLAASGGTAIYAAQSGVVVTSTKYGGGYGYYVKIRHDNGLETLYAHCSALLVQEGQTVQRGQVIAKVGSTGAATGPHLHFEVILNGQYQQPLNYISDN